MKNTLRIACAIVLALFVLNTASAQRFGVKAGLNLASISYSDDYLATAASFLVNGPSTSVIPSFHVGAQAEFDFNGPIGLSVGAQLSIKGGKLEGEGTSQGCVPCIPARSVPCTCKYPSR